MPRPRITYDQSYEVPGVGELVTLSGDGTESALQPLDPDLKGAVFVAGLAWLFAGAEVKSGATAGAAFYAARKLNWI